MPNKWTRPKSLGELQNQSYDHDFRLGKTAPYGWDGAKQIQLRVDADGNQHVRVSGEPVQKNANYSTAQTDTTVWTPTAGTSIVLMGIMLSTDTQMSIKLQSNSSDILPPCYLSARGGAVISTLSPIWKGGTNDTIEITSSTAGNHSVLLWGYEE